MTIFSTISYIISNAVASNRNSGILYSRSCFFVYSTSMIFIYFILDWYFFELSLGFFSGLIYTKLNNLIFIYFILFLTFCILILTSFYPMNSIQDIHTNFSDKEDASLDVNQENLLHIGSFSNNLFNIKDLLQIERDHYKIIEYTLILQFIVVGGITLLSSNDLITIFLSIELQSYGLYILSTIYRNSEESTGAGLTYFLLGGLSSCIILLGLSFIYINSGSTNLDGLYLINNIITSDHNLLSLFLTSDGGSLENNELTGTLLTNLSILNLSHYQYTIQLSMITLTVGFLFKISAAPFHSWSPGVYDAIPTVTTTFVAIIPKISILMLLLDLVYYTWNTTFNFSWTSILLFSSFLSLVIGSVLGLTQFKIKRLYAYSTISHVGFILLALSIHSVESIQAFFFYIIQYSLSNLNAFFILILIGYTYINYKKKTKNYESSLSLYHDYRKKLNVLSPIDYIDTLKGYFYLNPLLTISLSVTLYSFIGVPPLVGFFAKQMILSSALDNGDIFMCLVAILTSVVSAVYYLYIVKTMFFEKSKYNFNALANNKILKNYTYTKENYKSEIILSNTLTGIISILSLMILLFIFLYYEIYFLMNIISILLVY